MTNIFARTLQDAYQAIAQQFDLYRLIDKYQSILIDQQPAGWKTDYCTIEKIKQAISNSKNQTEGFVAGIAIKTEKSIPSSNCALLFQKETDGQ